MTSKETGRDMLEMKGISKSFFGVRVLDKVDLTVGHGEVHALLGENGAGKSTLMNILGGVYTRDAGQVIFLGKPLENTTVRLAENAGIAFVHQELNLFNDLRVYENIFLRKEIVHSFGVLAKKEMIARTQELMAQLGVDIPATAMVSELETSKKQMLEIAKALYAKAELFILDEPTTSLNTAEIEMLFDLIRRLGNTENPLSLFPTSSRRSLRLLTATPCCATGRWYKPGTSPRSPPPISRA